MVGARMIFGAIGVFFEAKVNPNSELYASAPRLRDSLTCDAIPSIDHRPGSEAGVNFVFGTTGGDRDALMKVTQESGVYAVIESWPRGREPLRAGRYGSKMFIFHTGKSSPWPLTVPHLRLRIWESRLWPYRPPWREWPKIFLELSPVRSSVKR